MGRGLNIPFIVFRLHMVFHVHEYAIRYTYVPAQAISKIMREKLLRYYRFYY